MNLNGKTAVVTGASSGIGKAIAEALLQEGMHVAGWQRSAANIQHSQYTNITCNVGKQMEVLHAADETVKRLGGIDVLINNAGLGYFGKMHLMDETQWHEMFNVNVHGMFYCVKAIAPLMISKQSGHIVNIASIAGKQAVVEGAGYSATKFAVTAISSALFRELRQHNIKVSVVYPGSTNTHFFDNVEHKLRAEDMIRPEDIAASVVHLLKTPADFLPFELEVRTMRAK